MEVNCLQAENALSCTDCSFTQTDRYCHKAEDHACDPDCGNLDADCKEEVVAKSDVKASTRSETVLQYAFSSFGLFLLVIFILFVIVRDFHVAEHKKDRLLLMQHYIFAYKEQGYGDTAIKAFFLKRGYEEAFINKAFNTLEHSP